MKCKLKVVEHGNRIHDSVRSASVGQSSYLFLSMNFAETTGGFIMIPIEYPRTSRSGRAPSGSMSNLCRMLASSKNIRDLARSSPGHCRLPAPKPIKL